MKKEVLSILEWNLNFGSYDGTNPASFIAKYIEGHDIVVLTEVRANEKLISIIQSLGYDYIASEDQGEYSNQIVILAKKKIELKKIIGVLNQDNGEIGPDFLHGTIKVGEKIVNILGARVKTVSYSERYLQVELMKSYLASLGGSVICTGDFNSGQIRGNDDAKYSDVQPLYKYRNGTKELSDLRFYNFHRIKELLGEEYVLKEIMGEDNSWGLIERYGSIVYGYGSRVKNDLLFYSDDIEGTGSYSWEHVRQNIHEYIDMFAHNRGRRGNKIAHGYPDHARLIAKLVV